MNTKRLDDFLHALDPSRGERLWYGGATLLGALRGVSAEQAAWKPHGECSSIWQIALHCAYAKCVVRCKLQDRNLRGEFPRRGGYWPQVPAAISDRSWSADRDLLREEHERLLGAAEDFDPARLDRKVAGSKRWTHADLLLGIVMHDTYHAGQIQIMKLMWDRRNP